MQLSDDEVAVRATVRWFVERRVSPHVADWFEQGRVENIRALARDLGELGVLGMHLTGYGCAGMSARRGIPGHNSALGCPVVNRPQEHAPPFTSFARDVSPEDVSVAAHESLCDVEPRKALLRRSEEVPQR